jgi:copper/silver efflux system protein
MSLIFSRNKDSTRRQPVAQDVAASAAARPVILIYLDHALDARRAGRVRLTRNELRRSPRGHHARRGRARAFEMMAVVAIMAGRLPILWSHGAGSEVMQRTAVPMIGGMVSSNILAQSSLPESAASSS